MSKPSDHIPKGALCVFCQKRPASVVTRLVARDDSMEQDALLWGAATCWHCTESLKQRLNAGQLRKPG
jgi:hypothetical protein